MKLCIEKEYLQKATQDNPNLLLTEEQKYEMERIHGMIFHNIHFCSLVTGFRGTGKSSFINYTLEQAKGSKKSKDSIIVVAFNATRYKDYETFLRRFVRELFLSMNESSKASKQLENIFRHTFYDIKEYNSLSMTEKNNNIIRDTSDVKTLLNGNVNISKLVQIYLKFSVFAILLIAIFLNVNEACIKILCSIITVIGACIVSVFDLSLIKETTTEKATVNTNDRDREKVQSKTEEILYDEEIAEYYVFDEIKKISESGDTLIFVIDELDKIDSKMLEILLNDLKPLFLSKYCDFILIAGKNMDSYFQSKQAENDSVVSSFFTQKIYIPLSTIQDMRDFAEQFYQAKNPKNRLAEFYADINAQRYFNRKIFEAKGVRRTFVNSILADIRWEDDKPYIDLSHLRKDDYFDSIFVVLEKTEEYIYQNYTDSKRDELLLILYDCIENIQRHKHTTFTKDDIIGSNEKITKISNYTDIAEKTNLYDTLFKNLTDDNILEQNGNFYKWCSDITINANSISEEITMDEADRVLHNYVDLFIQHWEIIGTIIYDFAYYNGDISEQLDDVCFDIISYKSKINLMFENNRLLCDKLEDVFFYLEKFVSHGIEQEDIEDIKKLSQDLSYIKPQILEKLLEYTYIHKFKLKILNNKISINQYVTECFDIVCSLHEKSKMIITECKYYNDYMNAIRKDILYQLSETLSKYMSRHMQEDVMLNFVVFTDQPTEKGIKQFEEKSNKHIHDVFSTKQVYIRLIPLNDYAAFKTQMDILFDSMQ